MLEIEILEERIVPYILSPFKLPTDIVTVSLMPVGTQVDGQITNATVNKAVLKRALEAWAMYSPLTFHFVSDSGAPAGSQKVINGVPQFGDIRLGAWKGTPGWLSYAYNPFPLTSEGGDIVLNSSYHLNNCQLYVALLHETGVALGLDENNNPNSVMYPYYVGMKHLSSDDIAGIRAIYGQRIVTR